MPFFRDSSAFLCVGVSQTENDSPWGETRVIELDPVTLDFRWVFEGTPENHLQSKTCGSNQRLPGGTTLITESDNGRALEVTREGEIVWEFVSPHRAGDEGELIATLFELIRLPPDFPLDWLE